MAEWNDKITEFREAGFSDQEIFQYEQTKRQEFQEAGFVKGEIDEYFGVKQFDQLPSQEVVKNNIEKFNTPDPVTGKPKKQATNIVEALEAGWDMSVTGLLKNAPDVELGGDAGMFYRLAAGVAGLAGDLPAMVAGGAAGGAAGSAVPLVGNTIGAASGAFALPSSMRKVLMDHYEKGDVKDFGDFWERSVGATWEGIKGGITGAATAGMGAVVGKLAKPFAGPVFGKSAQLLSEVGTMVAVGKALEGEAPKPMDFIDAGILVLGVHGVSRVLPKGKTVQTEFGEVAVGTGIETKGVEKTLRQVYAETGSKPGEVALEAQRNPILQQELLAENPNMERIKGIMGEKPSLDAPKEVDVSRAGERGSISGKPIKEPPKFERTEAEQVALDKIQSQPGKPGKLATFIDSATDLKEHYRNYVDKLDPLTLDQEGYDAARMAPKYLGKAIHAIEFGTLDFKTLEPNGKSLKEAVSGTPDKVGLDAYLFAATEAERGRIVGEDGAPRKTRIPLETADKIVSEGKERFAKVAEEVTAYQNRNWDYLKDAGIISEEFHAAAKALNKNYAPLKAIIDPESAAAGKKPGKEGFLKAAKGGEGAIQSPLQTIKENTETIFRISEKNRARLTFIDNVLKDPEQTLLERVKTKNEVMNPPKEAVKKFFEENGLAYEEYSAKERKEIYKQGQQAIPGLADEITVLRNGVKETYKTTKPIAEALKSLDGSPAAQNVFMTLMQTTTKAIKLGTTMMPDFTLRNMIRDQVQTGVFTKGNVIPFVDVWTAMGHILKKDNIYQEALKSGALGGQFMDFNAEYFSKDILQMQKETGFLSTARNVLPFAGNPLAALKFGNYLIESAPRVAEYKKVRKAGGSVQEAGKAGGEVTLDFQRMGARMQAWNSISAFANVQVLSLDKTWQMVKNDKKALTARGFTYITTPSLLLWWANHDEDWYKAIPRWEKDLFWHIPIDPKNGVIIRIPKPGELGIIFGTLPERILEKTFSDNPRAMKDFSETMQALLLPNLIPDLPRVGLEHYSNKNFFMGSPIVSRRNEKYVAAEQYTEYTSESAKQIAKMVSALDSQVHKLGIPSLGDIGPETAPLGSPQVIDHYIHALAGQGGSYLTLLIDQALYASGAAKDLKPKMALADIPIVKAFVSRYPRANAQQITDFNERYIESKKNLDTFKMMQQTGRRADAAEFFREHQDEMFTVDETKKVLEDSAMRIRKLHAIPLDKMPAAEKRQIIDSLYFKMIQSADRGLRIMDTLDKKRKQLK